MGFAVFYIIFGVWNSWLIIGSISRRKRAKEKGNNFWPDTRYRDDAGNDADQRSSESENFAGLGEFIRVGLIVAISLLGILGIAWFTTAG